MNIVHTLCQMQRTIYSMWPSFSCVHITLCSTYTVCASEVVITVLSYISLSCVEQQSSIYFLFFWWKGVNSSLTEVVKHAVFVISLSKRNPGPFWFQCSAWRDKQEPFHPSCLGARRRGSSLSRDDKSVHALELVTSKPEELSFETAQTDALLNVLQCNRQ